MMASNNLWNYKDLKPPPVISCVLTAKEIDVRLLTVVIKDAYEFFKEQQHLPTEAALLSRTIYRLKLKFRSSKDFKSTEILSRILRKYLDLNFYKTLKDVLKAIPIQYNLNKRCTLTKNMIDYVLVRIQGIGKLLCRILETCKQVAALSEKRLRLGHFWKLAIIILSTTSRIFVLCKNILKYICELYTNLLPFSTTLTNCAVQWLPNDYSFPKNLDEWLDIQWLELENNIIEIPDDEPIFSYMKISDSDDDEIEFCDEYVVINDEIFIGECSNHHKNTQQVQDVIKHEDITLDETNDLAVEEVDIGEVVDITKNNANEEKHKDSNQQNVNKLKNKKRNNSSQKIELPPIKKQKVNTRNQQNLIELTGNGTCANQKLKKRKKRKQFLKNNC